MRLLVALATSESSSTDIKAFDWSKIMPVVSDLSPDLFLTFRGVVRSPFVVAGVARTPIDAVAATAIGCLIVCLLLNGLLTMVGGCRLVTDDDVVIDEDDDEYSVLLR